MAGLAEAMRALPPRETMTKRQLLRLSKGHPGIPAPSCFDRDGFPDWEDAKRQAAALLHD